MSDISKQDLQDNIRSIRKALLIGLECYGEVERITDHHDSLTSFGGNKPDAGLRPIHPTGSPETIGMFACALRLLSVMEESHD